MYDLLNLLDSILGSHQKHAHNEFYWSCPFCHHHNPKLAINITKGAWHCWVCNVSGHKLYSLFKKLDCSKEHFVELSKILNERIDYTIDIDNNTTQLMLPREYIPLWKPLNRIDYKHALRYVLDRGLSKQDILRYQIGYCYDGLYSNRIIIPSYDEHNKLNYFVGRSFYDHTMKYKNPPVSKNVIGFENSINWMYPIVLCEGVYDAMTIKRNAIPLLGKTPPSKLIEKIIIKNVNHIYLALDNDAIKQTAILAQQFIKEGRTVSVVVLDGKDPSELGFVHMQQLIAHAKPLSFVELIKLRATA